MPKLIVVDANPLLSALLSGRVLQILFSTNFEFVTSEKTIWEVKKYIPDLTNKLGQKSEFNKLQKKKIDIEQKLFQLLNDFQIIAIPPNIYDSKIRLATTIIGNRDSKDTDILALSLYLNAPLWSNDKDFEGILEIELLKTSDLLLQI